MKTVAVFAALFALVAALDLPRFDYAQYKKYESMAEGPIAAKMPKVSYSGFKDVHVGPLTNQRQIVALESLRDEETRRILIVEDVITTRRNVNMVIAPEKFEEAKEIFAKYEIPFRVTAEDLQKELDKKMALNALNKAAWEAEVKNTGEVVAPSNYLTYPEIVDYTESLARRANNPNSVYTFNVGGSYEGRQTIGLVVNGDRSLPVVFLDAGIHAREWLAPATTLYLMEQLIAPSSSAARYLRDNYIWVIIPVANPDGYEYTWTGDRYWRKTLTPYGLCYGADPNRNYAVDNFGGPGTSSNPCADTYHGPGPFSERETDNIRDIITRFLPTDPSTGVSPIFIYVTIHTYTQLWLVPFGGYEYKPQGYDDTRVAGQAAINAIRQTHGRNFRFGTPPDILYAAAGGSFDWTRETLNIKHSMCPELRPECCGFEGFAPGPENIIPSGQEILNGLHAYIREAERRP